MDKRMLMGTVAAGLLVAPIATHLMWNTGTLKPEQITSGESTQEVLQDTTTSGTRGETTSEEFGRVTNEQVAAAPPVDEKAKPDSNANAPAPEARTDDSDGAVDLVELLKKSAEPQVQSKPENDVAGEAPAASIQDNETMGLIEKAETPKAESEPGTHGRGEAQ